MKREPCCLSLCGVLLLSAALLMLAAPDGEAQYFGRNKVQYEQFDFEVLNTAHFKIYHYPQAREATADASRMAERWYVRLSTIFQHELDTTQPIILYANHADFQQTNVISGLISQGTGGVTEGLKNRVVMPFTGHYRENNHVLGHELVHAFQYSIMKEGDRGLSRSRQIPLWFVEGMSEYLVLGHQSPLTAMWLRDAVLNDNVPTIDEMTGDPNYFPYRWGHAFWSYMAGRYGDRIVADLFRGVSARGFKTGRDTISGMSIDTLSAEWQQAIRDRYGPQLEGRTRPDDVGRAALSDGSDMVLSPSISPDGRYAAVITRKDIFTLDLYLADLAKGEIIDKLASSNTDAHFDALRFMNSSGAWSPDGRRFAFVVGKDGDDGMAILDVTTRRVERTLKFDQIDAITYLAWSPDGTTLLISASSGGISDLYQYDLKADKLKPLTRDRYADLQPAWSPDGGTIVFVTDRGEGTDFDRLTFRPLQIALLDTETGSMEFLAISEQAKHINPHFAPDGRSIYFVSDPDGFSNIYRYSLAEESFQKITNVATGVSGLTETSPSLSVASKSGDIIFTVFDDTDYKLRALDPDPPGEVVSFDPGAYAVGADLPGLTATSTVSEYLQSPEEGLPEAAGQTICEYDPSLSLVYAGQSQVGVAVDRFGTSLGGAASFLFSDMLGNRMLGITAQVNGGFKDLGGQVFYQNRRHRINWGAGAGHIPYVTAGYRTGFDTITVNGQERQAFVQEIIRERVFLERASLMADYPLSTNRRFEGSVGYSYIWYDAESDKAYFVDGFFVDERSSDLPSPSPLNLVQSSLAYVGDYSLFGFTSPVKGTRYRLEVEPTFGSLTYLSVLADFRQYFFLRPFTFALRGMHYGRYLDDAEDNRLSALYLGFQTLVRGYNVNQLDASECGGGEDCAVYDRLLGSRIGVMNLEWRFPLFGTTDYGLVDFSYLPTELVAFLDGGVAWSKGDEPVFKLAERSTERIPVFSAGVAARINLFGYLIGQVYLAFPFQRPDQTTQFGFVIAPGW